MARLKFVKITSKGYGRRHFGTKIYFEGPRPKFLKDDGSFQMGKNLVEFLQARYKKVKIIITNRKSKVSKSKGSISVRLTPYDLRAMQSLAIDRGRDVKMRVISKKLADLFPREFAEDIRLYSYERGMFAGILRKDFIPTRLSNEDRTAMSNFIPRFIASGIGTTDQKSAKITAGIELKVLKAIAEDLKKRLANDKSESTWQDYLKQNILRIQQGYIALIDKANIAVIGTKFPDFLLVTHDGYLDILEIKTPVTQLLSQDEKRNNFFWSTELSKAISQTENYLDAVHGLRDRIRTAISDKYGIELRVVKPRGIIFAGDAGQFGKDKKMADDFRLLNQGLKNISIVTYDELFVRLQNYIAALADLGN